MSCAPRGQAHQPRSCARRMAVRAQRARRRTFSFESSTSRSRSVRSDGLSTRQAIDSIPRSLPPCRITSSEILRSIARSSADRGGTAAAKELRGPPADPARWTELHPGAKRSNRNLRVWMRDAPATRAIRIRRGPGGSDESHRGSGVAPQPDPPRSIGDDVDRRACTASRQTNWRWWVARRATTGCGSMPRPATGTSSSTKKSSWRTTRTGVVPSTGIRSKDHTRRRSCSSSPVRRCPRCPSCT